MVVPNRGVGGRIDVLVDLIATLDKINDPGRLLEAFAGAMDQLEGPRAWVELSTHDLPPGHYCISRLRTSDGVERVERRYPWDTAGLPARSGGFLGQIASADRPVLARDLDLSGDTVAGKALAEYHSAIAAPIYGEAAPGYWVVLLHQNPRRFDDGDLEQLVLRANLVGQMCRNLITAERLRDANRHIEQEIERIASIQRQLLPEAVPQIPGMAIATDYRTFGTAGGDMYDLFPLGGGAGERRWALLVADASGHGPAAAVVIAMVHSILHAYPRVPAGPGEMLRHVNRHLCAKRIAQSFVTAFLAFYDPMTRQLSFARAGHNPPLLKDFPHRGPSLLLDAAGEMPLGIEPDVDYSQATVTLRPGQTLILYTDGITEARRAEGEMFGIDGIEKALVECTGAPTCVIDHIGGAVREYQKGIRPDDDQTIIALQVLPEAQVFVRGQPA